MVFHWSLSDSKSPQVSRTLLSILAVLNNVVVWMVSTRPLTSKSFSPFNSPLVTVTSAPITIGIIVTFMFHIFFFYFPSKVEVLILVFTFFQFYSVVSRDSKIYNFAGSLFLVDYYYYYYCCWYDYFDNGGSCFIFLNFFSYLLFGWADLFIVTARSNQKIFVCKTYWSVYNLLSFTLARDLFRLCWKPRSTFPLKIIIIIIVDLAVPVDHILKIKEKEKIEKYFDLVRELKKKLWNMKVTVIPDVIGALGTILKG